MEAGSREYVLGGPGQQGLNQVLDELTATLAIAGPGYARPARVQRTWLDTFDWRLYRAGLTLQHVSSRGGVSELRLTGPDGLRLTAPAGRPRWPGLAEALPAGPLRDRVAPVAGIRALLPIGTALSQVRELRLLNEDEKTVARLVVDQMSLPAPAGGVLPTRLAVTEVRGYQPAARRARRVLAGTAGVAASRLTALDAVLHAAGRQAASYSGKVDVVLRPGMAGRDAVTAVLLEQLDTLEANVEGVLRDIDTEFLHDLRVAVRRTRSALKLLGDVLPGEFTLRFASEFRWLGDLTTPVRDLDVHLLSFPRMKAALVAAGPADLDPFHAFLIRRRSAERRKLSRGLRSARFASAVGDWRKALLGAQHPAGGTGVRGGPRAADLSADRIRRAHARVIRLGSSITDASPAENLHTLRKRCKELRYVLEFFTSLHDPELNRAVIGDLKRLQDCLGEFQDSEVEREEIQSLGAAMLAQQAAPASTLLAMGELAAQLAGRQHRARAEFAQRFAEFSGIPGRRRIAALTAAAAT
ncbi:MAG TPA: CHAD domain-containing protein [Streptosporangiaceae bacterium]